MSSVKRILFCGSLFCVSLFCVPMFGQDYRATLLGQVTDSSGAFVPNATVKATNLDTGSVTEAKTNNSGSYTLPYLQPGNYNVEITAEGFQGVKRENIVLRVADKQNLPVVMQIGQMTQEVLPNSTWHCRRRSR